MLWVSMCYKCYFLVLYRFRASLFAEIPLHLHWIKYKHAILCLEDSWAQILTGFENNSTNDTATNIYNTFPESEN
jgi:hypothetical protein